MSEKRIRPDAGYSLAEMMVVLGIIGVMSMVTIPMLMNGYRSMKMKGTVRQFITEMRGARQRAITQNHPTMISFRVGQRGYGDFDGTVAGGVTTFQNAERTPSRELDPIATFRTSTDPCLFANDVTSPILTASMNDIIFLPNGSIQNIPTCTDGLGRIVITTQYQMPKQTYTIDVFRSGQMKAN